MLENGLPKSSNYLGQSNKIHHVIIRLGASPYGKNAELGEPTKSTNPDEIVKMVKVCEEYGIPYGYYYYSTGINNKEALNKFKIIKNLKKTVEQKYKKSTGKKTSPDLPIFVDVENAESGNNRLMQKKEGETEAERMKRVTKAEALLINELANEYGRENVGLYTDSRSANIVFDADALLKYVDNPNLPVWVANAYSFRNVVNKETTRESTTKFVETMKDKGYNVIMQQRALETNGCDVSIMEESAYKDIMDIENEEQNKELGIDRE